MSQPHVRRHSEGRSRGLGQARKDALHLLQCVCVGLLRLSSRKVHGRVAGGVLPLEVVLLLAKVKIALITVAQGISAQATTVP